MAYDFKNIRRCGARCRTRGGAPCLGPAMANGRCRMHSGIRRLKHGRETKMAKEERRRERAFIAELEKCAYAK